MKKEEFYSEGDPIRQVVIFGIERALAELSKSNVEGGVKILKTVLSSAEDLSDDEDIIFIFFVTGGSFRYVETRYEEYEDGKEFIKEIITILEHIVNALKENKDPAQPLKSYTRLLHSSRNKAYTLRKIKGGSSRDNQ